MSTVLLIAFLSNTLCSQPELLSSIKSHHFDLHLLQIRHLLKNVIFFMIYHYNGCCSGPQESKQIGPIYDEFVCHSVLLKTIEFNFAVMTEREQKCWECWLKEKRVLIKDEIIFSLLLRYVLFNRSRKCLQTSPRSISTVLLPLLPLSIFWGLRMNKQRCFDREIPSTPLLHQQLIP